MQTTPPAPGAFVLLAALLVMLLPAVAAAQEPVTSFDQLNTRLKPGDTVWVTDAQGREITGKIRDLTPASLLLDAGGVPQDFKPARVGIIQVQPRDSRWNGVLIGAVAGLAIGAASCALNPECARDEGGLVITVGLGVIGTALGAGIGVLVDGAVKGPKVVVYRAPGSARSGPGSQVALAPMLRRGGAGVALSVAF